MDHSIFKKYLEEYTTLHQLRSQVKQKTSAIRETEVVLLQMFSTVPHTSMQYMGYTIGVHDKKVAAGLNTKVLKNGYASFQQTAHNRTAGEDEQKAFLETLKTTRKQMEPTIKKRIFVEESIPPQ